MEVSATHPFPCSVDELISHFFDEQQIATKNNKLGCQNLAIQVSPFEANNGVIKVSRDVRSSTPIPSALKSFHTEINRLTQIEEWIKQDDGSYQCDYRIHIEGVPAKLTGKMHVTPHPEGAVNHISLRVDCKIPFLGKTVARFLAEDSRVKIEDEYHTIKSLLTACEPA